MFDTNRFIREIRRRPAIYDLNSEEYNDREAKSTAWEQVCELMVPKWRSLSREEKINQEKILRSKWRNIRDYFMKELKLQRTDERDRANGKRKKYVYFDQLLFLMTNVEKKRKTAFRKQANVCTEETSLEESIRPDDRHSMIEEYGMPLIHEKQHEHADEIADEKYELEFPKSICETSLASASDEYADVLSSRSSSRRFKNEDDYDRMFLLSLLPIMRKVPDRDKLDVRIKIQQLLATAIRDSPPTIT